mmetsp:Transcript_91828/g.259671  ORF Transcript_91828/g.259671 Transcript_91828/m.259671 type:complete len:311 (-) Transcript_91828:808-1740(-)
MYQQSSTKLSQQEVELRTSLRPPPQAQHISAAWKSSSSLKPQSAGAITYMVQSWPFMSRFVSPLESAHPPAKLNSVLSRSAHPWNTDGSSTSSVPAVELEACGPWVVFECDAFWVSFEPCRRLSVSHSTVLSPNLKDISFIAALNVSHWLGHPKLLSVKKPTLFRSGSSQRQRLGQMARSQKFSLTEQRYDGISSQLVMAELPVNTLSCCSDASVLSPEPRSRQGSTLAASAKLQYVIDTMWSKSSNSLTALANVDLEVSNRLWLIRSLHPSFSMSSTCVTCAIISSVSVYTFAPVVFAMCTMVVAGFTV